MSEQAENLSENSEAIANLHSLIESLRFRVQELEAENAKLSTLISNCHCHKMTGGEDVGVQTKLTKTRDSKTKLKKATKVTSGCNTNAIKHLPKRYVALKVMYFGQRFYGFASEAHMDPTVESEIFKALEKTRLLVDGKKESQYSRCGRTDKGVSSVGQVIALFLRSKLKNTDAGNKNSEQDGSGENTDGEIDYVGVLNQVLPKDIRVIGWCPVPIGFHARFSCLSRQYKYFFWKENLNISVMESAGKKLLGEHDFRNFCKMDAANVHNYRRHISSFKILPSDMRYKGNGIYFMEIKGSAFLWHQVRCMVAVLFMIGQGLESPEVIDALLDTDRTRRKPQYIMAPEIPLVLQSCHFVDLNFICSSGIHLVNECQNYQLHATIFHEAVLNCLPPLNGFYSKSMQSRPTRKKASHVPLMSRPTETSYEERRAKFTQEHRLKELNLLVTSS
ncbi:uncharacterized protein [Rutidosis leptorrhynchoides]|uniref:uncharacterized protein n=1 Tax=Rutidosis leptorrhynchoides TaxID=125765 RepID=UPI003A99984E